MLLAADQGRRSSTTTTASIDDEDRVPRNGLFVAVPDGDASAGMLPRPQDSLFPVDLAVSRKRKADSASKPVKLFKPYLTDDEEEAEAAAAAATAAAAAAAEETTSDSVEDPDKERASFLDQESMRNHCSPNSDANRRHLLPHEYPVIWAPQPHQHDSMYPATNRSPASEDRNFMRALRGSIGDRGSSEHTTFYPSPPPHHRYEMAFSLSSSVAGSSSSPPSAFGSLYEGGGGSSPCEPATCWSPPGMARDDRTYSVDVISAYIPTPTFEFSTAVAQFPKLFYPTKRIPFAY